MKSGSTGSVPSLKWRDFIPLIGWDSSQYPTAELVIMRHFFLFYIYFSMLKSAWNPNWLCTLSSSKFLFLLCSIQKYKLFNHLASLWYSQLNFVSSNQFPFKELTSVFFQQNKCTHYAFKRVMNWEAKILLIFWHIRGHCAINKSCKFLVSLKTAYIEARPKRQFLECSTLRCNSVAKPHLRKKRSSLPI